MLLYRLLLTLASPVLLLRLLREPRLAVERLGLRGPVRGSAGGVIWLHAASNGELTSARALIGQVLERRPEARLLVTCNTATGRALAAGWGLERVEVRLAPLDYRLTLRAFLLGWSPVAVVVIENELWPNRLALLARRGVPVLVMGARISARSAARWGRLPGLARAMLGGVAWLSAQDAESRARFIALGLSPDRAGPLVNLKSASAVTAGPDPAELAQLCPLFPRAETLLAASTHDGEEEIVLAAFARARQQRPGLRLILAPRHPRRGAAVARAISAAGLAFATRSAGQAPMPGAPVYLADTMGEMALWYALAGVTFVGGSLVEKGGHTPYEPATQGSALLHGPHVANFADAYAELDAAGAARQVTGADTLAAALTGLDAAAQRAMARRATEVLARPAEGQADPVQLADALIARLDPDPAAKETPHGRAAVHPRRP